jgi:hypothetical protein
MGHSFDLDHVRRSAAGMIATFGGEAAKICQEQIDKMRRRGDVAGERIWREVLEHIQSGRVTRLEAGDNLDPMPGNAGV